MAVFDGIRPELFRINPVFLVNYIADSLTSLPINMANLPRLKKVVEGRQNVWTMGGNYP
jgi:hypothetical protein